MTDATGIMIDLIGILFMNLYFFVAIRRMQKDIEIIRDSLFKFIEFVRKNINTKEEQ